MSDRKIGLSEWFAEIGDHTLKFQLLPDSLEGNQGAPKGGGSKLSFRTEEPLTPIIDGTRMAVVVWMNRADADAAMARLKAADSAAPATTEGEPT